MTLQMLEALQTEPLDVRNATEQDYERLNDFNNKIRAERLPDDPPIPLDEAIAGWRSLPPLLAFHLWVVRGADGTQIVAAGQAEFMRTDNNPHLLDCWIAVLPSHRRQGLATQLLARIVELARREQRRLLMSYTSERVPAGEAFVRRLGATFGLARHTNQLLLAELDRALIREWQTRAQERAAGFELGLWTGPYPDADIDAVVALNYAMNGEPRDGLDLEDYHKGPDEIRQWERSMFERGTQRWTLYARERATGSIAGYTEVFWNPNRPDILQQGATGVLPQYRNKGIARWLKAAMLEKILRDRPQVTRIRTGNADSNAPMLHINHQLGFKPYISASVWQATTEQVEAYLRTRLGVSEERVNR